MHRILVAILVLALASAHALCGGARGAGCVAGAPGERHSCEHAWVEAISGDHHHGAELTQGLPHRHCPDSPSHVHACSRDPGTVPSRGLSNLPRVMPTGLVAKVLHAEDGLLPRQQFAARRPDRWCTGPPSFIRTTRLLI